MRARKEHTTQHLWEEVGDGQGSIACCGDGLSPKTDTLLMEMMCAVLCRRRAAPELLRRLANNNGDSSGPITCHCSRPCQAALDGHGVCMYELCARMYGSMYLCVYAVLCGTLSPLCSDSDADGDGDGDCDSDWGPLTGWPVLPRGSDSPELRVRHRDACRK